ncbi:MAG: hypothetical protein M3R59_02915 [Verrucomicrobiota bacterium]|nr:hypothetical protein [Verrucomicrobiota bacterium]
MSKEKTGVANPAVIDVYSLNAATGEVLLVMNETRAWGGGDEQLHELQEKFNAYASFILDGEMTTEHPELRGKKARIELHCANLPGDEALALLGAIHDQLELQDITVEVVVADAGGCGDGCACHSEQSRGIPEREL